MKMKIHHIAIATKNIGKSCETYMRLGYSVGNIVDDIQRDVRICFITLGHVRFELVQPLSIASPVSKILEKTGHNSIYHVCYETDKINDSIEDLAKLGFMAISKMESAPAIDEKRVVFLFHKTLGLIELVEN
ncbi:MAG: VOC family protein [Gammaproteobacteria bacterium]